MNDYVLYTISLTMQNDAEQRRAYCKEKIIMFENAMMKRKSVMRFTIVMGLLRCSSAGLSIGRILFFPLHSLSERHCAVVPAALL